MNNVNPAGRLTRDSELRQASETSITTVFVATDQPKLNKEGRSYKDGNGFSVKETEFHKVTCFNGLAKAVASAR